MTTCGKCPTGDGTNALDGDTLCPAHRREVDRLAEFEPKTVRYHVIFERHVGKQDFSDVHGGSGVKAANQFYDELWEQMLFDPSMEFRVVRRALELPGQRTLKDLPGHYEDDPIEIVILEVDDEDEA